MRGLTCLLTSWDMFASSEMRQCFKNALSSCWELERAITPSGQVKFCSGFTGNIQVQVLLLYSWVQGILGITPCPGFFWRLHKHVSWTESCKESNDVCYADLKWRTEVYDQRIVPHLMFYIIEDLDMIKAPVLPPHLGSIHICWGLCVGLRQHWHHWEIKCYKLEIELLFKNCS